MHQYKKNYPFLLPILVVLVFFFTFFTIVTSYSHVRIPAKSHPIEMYANGLQDDLRLLFKEAIFSAKKSICLVIYSLTDSQIIRALRKKADEGVEITLICDSQASKRFLSLLGSKVKVIFRKPKGIMHLKILVIDGKRSWIGSANMTTESLRFHGNLVTGFYHPDLAQLLLKKAQEMDQEIPCTVFNVRGRSLEIWSLPNQHRAAERIQEMIKTAEKTIKVAMFTWTRTDFVESLISAKKRGVDVRVVMDRYAGKGANRTVVEMLAKENIPVSFSEGSALLHYKMMLIDDRILVNGSANWTKSAFAANDDCFFILRDLTTKEKKMMRDLWDVIQEDSFPVNFGFLTSSLQI